MAERSAPAEKKSLKRAAHATRGIAGRGAAGTVFPRLYQAILVSDENEAQVERMVYLLSHGTKEGLVARPRDWPGVHCIEALLSGEPLAGTWFDRTKEYLARQRGEECSLRQYATTEVLRLDPLPCWRHLSPERYRARIAEMVKEIEDRCAAERQARGVEPPGPAVIRAQRPFDQPMKTKRSPAPFVHAFRKKIRRESCIELTPSSWPSTVRRPSA